MPGVLLRLADPQLPVRVWEDDEVPQLAEFVTQAWNVVPPDDRRRVATWLELQRSPKELQLARLSILVASDTSRGRVAWTDARQRITLFKPVVPEMLQQGRADLVIGTIIHEFGHFVLSAQAGTVGKPGMAIEDRVDILLEQWGLPHNHREQCLSFLRE